ncbi:hypothetical protein L210DRAFT_3613826 [Boletus edulis BED1]|uniref:MYND-type domain-containing protein n=1 Tax=Boletus edulis BED1 TaxID=1328754 RepID=A0AAD4BM14_BOLED|nr:hypothetical protein L210DRAFT_3613826 [Boletus edulis BED1]
MPGPRAKRNNAAKKNKSKTVNVAVFVPTESLRGPPLPQSLQHRAMNSLDELSADDWDEIVRVMCDHLKIPDLTKRSGLKKVYNNFDDIYKRIDDLFSAHPGNQIIRGGVVAIYAKMSADSILRNLLFQKSLLAKILPLVEKDNSRHIALRALTTVTHHGGTDIRKEITLHAPTIVKVLQDHPDDLHAAEFAISSLAHAVTASIDEPQRPAAKYIKALQLPTLLPIVLDFVAKPGASLQLLHHALELCGHLTQHCTQECLAYPAVIDFLIASIRSPDLHSRFYALGAVIRLHKSSLDPEILFNDPGTLMTAVQRGLPNHLAELIVNYGPARCESTMTLRTVAEYQRAMLQCVHDRDLYKLGLTLAELIPRNEFSINEGGFQAVNQNTGKPEFISPGLPFTMWADALPVCAKEIRQRRRSSEEDLADMLDLKYFVIRSRLPEAIALAKKSIERNPKFPYFYYIMTLGSDLEEGLRYAKKGLKVKNATPFVHYVLLSRAIEIAGNLAICRIQESTIGDRKWEEGLSLLSSALDDAHIYLAEAPPDTRHRKSVLYWFLALTLADKGPELSEDLKELDKYVDQLKIADEFYAVFGADPPMSQLRQAQVTIFERYQSAAQQWGHIAARFDSTSIDHEHVVQRDRPEDQLAAWLHDFRHRNGDDIDDDLPEKSSHPKWSTNPAELHKCSWCGNPSAVLRRCGGCEKARYCDASCQKSAWSEHKIECNSRKASGSSV